MQIDEHIHQLALRLGRVLDAYRATKPEFGRPIPRIEDDLERYARRCLEIDRRVGLIADAFEHAGSAPHGGSGGATSSQPVVAAEATIAAALEQAQRAKAAPPRPKRKEHHDHGLLGGLIHAVEHPADTLSDAASSVEHVASDAWGTVEHAADHRLHDVEDAGAALVHGIEHPAEALDAAASGLEKAAGEVADLGGHAVSGATSAGGEVLHAVEHPLDTLSSAEQAVEDFVTGFATGVRDMAQAAMLLARVIPGTPMWTASMAIDPEGTVKLQAQFAKGLAHMVEHPLDTLGNMIDINDLESGDYARWLGHLTPDVIVTVLTAGGGGAAAAAGEGVAKTAAEATAEEAATTVAEDAARTAAESAGKATVETTAGARAAETAGRAADDLSAEAAHAGGMSGAELPPEPLSGTPIPAPEDLSFEDLLRMYGQRLTVDGQMVSERELDFAGVTPKQVADALSGAAPLGTTPVQWASLQSDLTVALHESGLEGAELGQAGSSINFYAGRAKPFPQNAEEAAAQADDFHAAAEAAERYNSSPYGEAVVRPTRHFFDSRYRLGIDEQSDIDFSISGPRVAERMAEFQAEHPEIKDLISSHGGVYKTRYLRMAFPHLADFMNHWTTELGGREVNIVGKVTVVP